jgi:hypothetical protein
MIHTIEEMFPQARGMISSRPSPLRMANQVSDSGLQALIGPFRPLDYREGVRRTADFYSLLERRMSAVDAKIT